MYSARRATGASIQAKSEARTFSATRNPQIIQTHAGLPSPGSPWCLEPLPPPRLIQFSSMSFPRTSAGCLGFRLTAAVILLALLPKLAEATEHTQPPVQPATDFAAFEVHADEKLAIAAEPYDTREKMALFRVDYISHGVMPIRLIVTNNSDRPISLRDARILYVTSMGDRIQAAEPEDVERLMTRKEREGSKIPMPGPIPAIKLKPKASDKLIEQDFDTFEFQALVVEPHTTRAGFLFYDVGGLTRPLQGALLNLHTIKDADGKDLFYFEIPFDKYLKTKSSQMN
jgi:hypothetical protein